MAVTENKYQLGTAENQKFLQDVRDGLLSFGHQFPSPGGSSYYLGDDGTPWKDRNRETWITSRMTHVYSIGSMLGHEGSEALADAALKGLRGELHDDQNGGWYAGLTKDNEIVPTKQCYAHAFVILAASSGVLACREGDVYKRQVQDIVLCCVYIREKLLFTYFCETSYKCCHMNSGKISTA